MNDVPLSALDPNNAFSPEDEALRDGPVSLSRRRGARQHAEGDLFAGKYDIIAPLGSGGMGTVWRAHSRWLDVDVAIKVLHREQVEAVGAERLLREARATARLGHPAIVRVFDFGETDAGQPFLVMELLEGMSLSAWLDLRGRMSATQAVQMLLPIASALVAAHAQGIVHRDIKPANIIAARDASGNYLPKIVDFGIAKLADGTGQSLTLAGMLIGSPEYMSPEQANGTLEVDQQTDVWALCVVLYELITGKRPFNAPTLHALICAVWSADPTPTTQLAAGDEALWHILEKGLRKAPEERWPTMHALGCALAAWAAERGVTVDAAGTSLTHQWLTKEALPPVASTRESMASDPHVCAISCGTRSTPRPDSGGTLVASSNPPAKSGTVRMAYANNGNEVAVGLKPRLQRAKPLLFGVLAACVAPLVITTALQVRGAEVGERAGAAPVAGALAARPTAPPMTLTSSIEAAQASPSIQIVPAIEGAPRTIASAKANGPTVTASNKTLARGVASAARPKRALMAMPLPAAPDF